MIDPLLESPLEMGEGLARTSESHIFADVVSAFFTSLALLTWQTNFNRNPIASLEI